MEAANDAVVITNDKSIICETNKIALEMFSLHSEDIIGAPLWSLCFDEFEQEKVKAMIASVLKTGKGVKKEFIAKRKNASFPALLSLGAGIYNKSQVTVSFIKDTTIEKKQNELLAIEQKRSEDLLLNIFTENCTSIEKGRHNDCRTS